MFYVVPKINEYSNVQALNAEPEHLSYTHTHNIHIQIHMNNV